MHAGSPVVSARRSSRRSCSVWRTRSPSARRSASSSGSRLRSPCACTATARSPCRDRLAVRGPARRLDRRSSGGHCCVELESRRRRHTVCACRRRGVLRRAGGGQPLVDGDSLGCGRVCAGTPMDEAKELDWRARLRSSIPEIIIGAIIGTAALALAVRGVEWRAVGDALLHTRASMLALALLSVVLGVLLFATRWWLLFAPDPRDLPFSAVP